MHGPIRDNATRLSGLLGLRNGEVLPDGALLIKHVRELPSLLQTV
jgi:hypothetical protein